MHREGTPSGLCLPTEATAFKLEKLFQVAYDELEGVTHDLGGSALDLSFTEMPDVTVGDIGALAIVCDRVAVQLTQCDKALELLRQKVEELIVLRADQQEQQRQGRREAA